MPDRLELLRADTAIPVAHGFFTRRGGVSEGIFGSLNMGLRNADDPANVAENYRRVERVMRVEAGHLAVARQMHGNTHVMAAADWRGDDRPIADAVISTDTDLAAAVLTADCVPVLLSSADGRCVAAIHAGWKGAKAAIIRQTVEAMTEMGADPCDLHAAIGPAIQQASYQVDADYRRSFVNSDPDAARFFVDGPLGKSHFDLAGFVADALRLSGVCVIENLGHDTCADAARFFSNRRAHKNREAGFGLQISAIKPGRCRS